MRIRSLFSFLQIENPYVDPPLEPFQTKIENPYIDPVLEPHLVTPTSGDLEAVLAARISGCKRLLCAGASDVDCGG